MRFRSGVQRGFSRLSDRLGGGGKQAVRLINWYVSNVPATSNQPFSYTLPAGTKRVEVVAQGGGGTASTSYAGTGGGSVEFHFEPSADGLVVSGTIGAASGYNAGNPTNVVVNLPDGLGQMVANGGPLVPNNSELLTGGSGSGPVGCIVRTGGGTGRAGQGPFGGSLVFQANRGGNGAGPYGGVGAVDEYPEPGGGSGVNRLCYVAGFVSIKCFGEPL